MQALIMVPLQEEMTLFRQACTAHGLATVDVTVGRLVAMRVPELGLTVAPGGLGKVQFAIQTQHVLVEIRGVTDGANSRAAADFRAHLATAMRNVAILMVTWLRQRDG